MPDKRVSTCIKLLAVKNVSMDLEKCNLFHDYIVMNEFENKFKQ